MLCAGLAAVIIAGTLLGVAAPASAAPPGLNVSADDVSLQVGGGVQTTTVKVTNNDSSPASTSVTINIPLSEYQVGAPVPPSGCTLAGANEVDCTITGLAANSTWTKVVQIKPPSSASIPAVDTKSGRGKATLGDGSSGTFNVTLRGAAAAPTTQAPTSVTQVSGTVKDIGTGQPIPGATVGLQDSAGHNFSTTTDNFGRVTFKSTQANPIAPGTLAIEAVKDGYKAVTKNANVQAGQSYNFQTLSLEATATPTVSAPAVADPSQPVPDSALPQPGTTNASGKGGGSGFSTILIVAGALLVLLGIGAIVFILVRRRRDDGEEPDELDEQAPHRGPTPVPASRGAYHGGADPTAVVGSGGYGDPTMVGHGAMGDAPTMMHGRPPVDEYPDPYGAPPPRGPQAGYGAAGYEGGGGYDSGAQTYGGGNTYGGQTYGGGSGYGAPDQGYRGATYGHPEPPPARGGYDDRAGGGHDDRAAGGYEPRGGGYDDRGAGGGYEPRGGGYDDRAAGGYEPRGGGYDDRGAGGYNGRGGGYDERAAGGYEPRGGGHDDRAAGGYDARGGGYDERAAGGYEPRGGGHDDRGAGGYDARGGGYDDRAAGGYNGSRAGRTAPPPDSRRPLDWLDD